MKISQPLAESLYWKWQNLKGKGLIKERLEWLNQTQWLTPGEIRELQFRKLKDILEHAYKTVPYYRHVFEERGITPKEINEPKDMQKLPLLTRDLLRTKQNDLVSSEADFKTLQTNYSSGSTGVRAEFKQDLNFRMWMRAHQLRTYSWCSDWKLGDPFVLLWGSEIYWSFKQFTDQLENFMTNRREFNTFHLSNKTISSFLKKLRDFKPVLVSTYTNAMYLIAKEAERQGVKIEGLRCIQATSEPVPDAMRERMRAIFGCEIYDKYGMRESNIISHESPNHEGMLIQSENVFVEFINTKGEPCKPGEVGRVVVTTLNNLSMPLIRYETSDLAAPLEGYCSSGMGLPRMTSVHGRLQDLILTPNGEHVDAYFFSYLMMRFKQIHWFQVVQSKLDELHIRMFVPDGLPKELRAELIERIHHHTGYPFKIDFELLDQMPESSTGKFRLCVSELGAQVAADGINYRAGA
jgi:phenylacetate-CoA ligase